MEITIEFIQNIIELIVEFLGNLLLCFGDDLSFETSFVNFSDIFRNLTGHAICDAIIAGFHSRGYLVADFLLQTIHHDVRSPPNSGIGFTIDCFLDRLLNELRRNLDLGVIGNFVNAGIQFVSYSFHAGMDTNRIPNGNQAETEYAEAEQRIGVKFHEAPPPYTRGTRLQSGTASIRR